MLLRPRCGPDAGDTRVGVAGVDDLLGETAAGNRPRDRRGVERIGGEGHVQVGKFTSSLILPDGPQNAEAAFKKLRQSDASVAVNTLLLYGPPLTEDDVQYLNSLNSQKSLVLNGPVFTDTEVKRLGRLRGPESLTRDTRVTDDGLKSLMGLDYLEFLEVSGGRITDAGLEHLAAMKGLRSRSRTRKSPIAGLKRLRDSRNSNTSAWGAITSRMPAFSMLAS